jgi:hypothetical protein
MCPFVQRRLQYQNYLQRKSVKQNHLKRTVEYLHLVWMEQNQTKLSIIKYWNKLQQNKSKIDFGGGLKLIPI